jgi:hypothetical protein
MPPDEGLPALARQAVPDNSRPMKIGTRPRGRYGRTLIGLEIALAVAAAGGGVDLAVVAPHDAMPADLLARTPFSSWVWPGVFLTATVAVPAAVVAGGALARRAYAHAGHPLLGVIVLGWIAVQLIVIGPTSFLQPFIAAWGALLLGLGAVNYREWHSRWGATDAECAAAMAGDELIAQPQFAPTRAMTIDAPPAAVWPWIVQLGYGRAGWYSYDLLDNGGRHSADRIVPEWQTPAVGDVVAMNGRPTELTAFRVAALVPERVLVWGKPDSSWVWQLSPTPAGGTRLVTRVRLRYAGATALLSAPLMEVGDFPMMRRCLYGIKRRAEARARSGAEPAITR